MKNKYCPLLSATADDSLVPCQGELCAWYLPSQHTRDEGRCAVQALALGQEKEDVRECITMKPVTSSVNENDHTYYTVEQVAQRYGVSSRVIYEALSSGRIRGVRIGGWRISEEALQDFEREDSFYSQKGGDKISEKRPVRTRRKRPIVTKILL